MQQRILGRTGIAVSQLGFGGLFTSALGLGYEESRAAVRRALELGINFFDTAPGYADSEAILGKILAEIGVPVVLSTKLGGRPQPFDPRNADHLRQSVEQSLRLLHRDAVDLLLIHEPDRPWQYDWWTDPAQVNGPVVDVLADLKSRGLIRFSGLGGTTVTELAHRIRSNRFDVVLSAFNYSVLFREAQHEVLPAARQLTMGIILGSVLQQGALGRRYDAVVQSKPAWLSEPRRQQFLALYNLLDQAGMRIAELCLRFAISNPSADCVLIGPKTAQQVEESVAAVSKGPLAPDMLARLDQIAALVPFRPFEEPMLLPLQSPTSYYGPGEANLGKGTPPR